MPVIKIMAAILTSQLNLSWLTTLATELFEYNSQKENVLITGSQRERNRIGGSDLAATDSH